MTKELYDKLETMENVTLVETLLAYQSKVEHLHALKESHKNDNPEDYKYYSSAYYEAMNDLITIKYKVVGKMRIKLSNGELI